jgi:hypothetical protein
MRSRVAQAALALLASGCCCAQAPQPPTFIGPSAASTGPLQAGAAVVPIALPNGVALAGYGSADRRQMDASILLTGGPLFGLCLDPDPSTAAVFFKPSDGALDPLAARALVLDNGTYRMAIVKVDAIGMSRTLRDEIAVQARDVFQVTDGLFAMVATHTHSGPGGVSDQAAWEIIASDCFAPSVYAAVRDAAVQALKNATAGLQPARLGVGRGVVFGATKLRGASYPSKPPMPDIGIGLVKVETTGTPPVPIAALFNFAVHGTWYEDSNLKTSADYMGAIEDRVDDEPMLAGVVPIFTNGAEGDVTPVKASSTQPIKDASKTVADAVVALWTATSTDPSVTLHGVFTDTRMPRLRYNPGCLPLAGSSTTLCDLTPDHAPITVPLPANWVSKTLPFQALRINDAVFIGMPGEPVTTLGLAMKQQAQDAGLKGFVLSLANDHGAYFTTPEQFDIGTYEGKATIYGRDTGAVVMQQSQLVIDKVK